MLSINRLCLTICLLTLSFIATLACGVTQADDVPGKADKKEAPRSLEIKLRALQAEAQSAVQRRDVGRFRDLGAQLVLVHAELFGPRDWRTRDAMITQSNLLDMVNWSEKHFEELLSLQSLAKEFAAPPEKPREFRAKSKDAVERSKRLYGHLTNTTCSFEGRYVEALISCGDLDLASSEVEQAIRNAKEIFGDQHPDYASALSLRCSLLIAQGNTRNEVIEIANWKNVLMKIKDSHPDIVDAATLRLAIADSKLARFQSSDAGFHELYARHCLNGGKADVIGIRAGSCLAASLLKQHKLSEAKEIVDRMIQLGRADGIHPLLTVYIEESSALLDLRSEDGRANAKRTYARLFERFADWDGRYSDCLIPLLINASNVYYADMEFELALSYADTAESIAQRTFSHNESAGLKNYIDVAQHFARIGKVERAEKIAASVLGHSKGQKLPRITNAQALVLLAQCSETDKSLNLMKAIEQLEVLRPEDDELLVATRRELMKSKLGK